MIITTYAGFMKANESASLTPIFEVLKPYELGLVAAWGSTNIFVHLYPTFAGGTKLCSELLYEDTLARYYNMVHEDSPELPAFQKWMRSPRPAFENGTLLFDTGRLEGTLFWAAKKMPLPEELTLVRYTDQLYANTWTSYTAVQDEGYGASMYGKRRKNVFKLPAGFSRALNTAPLADEGEYICKLTDRDIKQYQVQ